MSRTNPVQEPSMEEVLASIRRIIADDPSTAAQRLQTSRRTQDASQPGASPPVKVGAKTNPDPEPLRHMSAKVPQGVVPVEIDVAAAAEPAAAVPVETPRVVPAAPNREALEAEPMARPEPLRPVDRNHLLSPRSEAQTAGAFTSLASLVLSRDARTLEDLVGDMLKPLLRGWLDDNLPSLVERLVREEIERVSRGRR